MVFNTTFNIISVAISDNYCLSGKKCFHFDDCKICRSEKRGCRGCDRMVVCAINAYHH